MSETIQNDAWHQKMKNAFLAEDYVALKQTTQQVWDMRTSQMSMTKDEHVNLRELLKSLEVPAQVHPGYMAEYLANYFIVIDPVFAEETFRFAVAITMQMFGDRSFDAGRKIVALGHFLAAVKKETEAIQMLQVGILVLQECNTQGVSNYIVPNESLSLADLYRALGDDVNYEEIMTKVIRWYEQMLKNTHREEHSYGTILGLLTTAKLKLADHFLERTNPAAIDLYNELRETWLASEGKTLRQALCYNRIGIVYEKMRFWPEAISHYETARKLIVELFGESHADIPWCDERIRHCRQQGE